MVDRRARTTLAHLKQSDAAVSLPPARIDAGSPTHDPREVFANTLPFTGRALFLTAFVVAVGFLLLCVSQFRTLVRFGLLIGVGMVVSFLGSVTAQRNAAP